MNKNTKMILGVGAVAIVGYLVWKQMNKPKAAFANLTSSKLAGSLAPGCPCGQPAPKQVLTDGSTPPPGWVVCAGTNSAGQNDKMCYMPKTATSAGGLF